MTGAPRVWTVVCTVAVTLYVGLASAGAVPMPAAAHTTAVTAATGTAGNSSTAASPAEPPTKRACVRPTSPKKAACFALERTDVIGRTGVQPHATIPTGYGPADLQDAYVLPSATAGAGQTVAIVDAFDDPNAEADLAVYRSQFGLSACTAANGCFRKVDQRGGTTFPQPDAGWAGEISLDVDMVSAVCPNCHILLVEADDNDLANLAAGVDEAVALGAKYVSNSYGGFESSQETDFDVHFHHPGVAITASTGDNGFGVEYPAASRFVTAVGGTGLVREPTFPRGWQDVAWTGAGSGCSLFEDKPSWQTDTGCGHRTVGDVAAVADPGTGVAVYDTFQSDGWNKFGGTSVASPIIASTYALAGPPAANTDPTSYLYDSALTSSGDLTDVIGGGNGGLCNPNRYLCQAEPGYDGPTGLGVPHGAGAFVHHDPGTLAGTVTDATTGKPIPGAHISIRNTTTDDQGHYSLSLPAGDYHLTVTATSYQSGTADVTLAAGATLTQDFALTPLPRSAIAGTVTDGSGHGWPLYAKITATDTGGAGGRGHTFSTFTDPATGHYTLDVPNSTDYTLHTAAVGSGYDPADQPVHLATSDLTQDTALTTTLACDAPGYQATLTGPVETFSDSKLPKGWTVTNTDPKLPGYTATPGWQFTDPGGRGNHTGGDGGFAIVDSDHDGQHNIQDTYLTSPTTDLTSSDHPAVQFHTDLEPAANSTAAVDLSTDNGATWTTVWHQTGFPGQTGPAQGVVDIAQAAHQSQVKIRFHYTGNWSKWWAIDDAFLGNRTCDTQTGALLTGTVTDTATQAGINGATITSAANPDQHTSTVATPDDPNLTDGYYQLFTTATGSQQFTATAAGHNPTTATTTLTPDHTTRLDLTLTPTP